MKIILHATKPGRPTTYFGPFDKDEDWGPYCREWEAHGWKVRARVVHDRDLKPTER